MCLVFRASSTVAQSDTSLDTLISQSNKTYDRYCNDGKRKIYIAVNPESAPFAFNVASSNGSPTLTGLDIDLFRAIMDELEVCYEYVPVPVSLTTSQLVDQVNNVKTPINMAASAITITASRLQVKRKFGLSLSCFLSLSLCLSLLTLNHTLSLTLFIYLSISSSIFSLSLSCFIFMYVCR